MAVPLISVLMPVYNCEAFVAESVNCILRQTLGDFEFIIVNDGSTDGTKNVLETLARDDSRIRLFHQANQGVGAALNTALDLANGKYLARMDADDLTPLDRFQEQNDFLEANPDITVVGGWRRTFGDAQAHTFEMPVKPGHIKAVMLFRNPMSHPTVMMRHEAFRRHGWRYATIRHYPEDYDLWCTIVKHHHIVNLPRVYLEYRRWPGAECQQQWPDWDRHVDALQWRLLARIGLNATQERREIHHALAFDQIPSDPGKLIAFHNWLMMIVRHNERTPCFETAGLMRALTGRYIALVNMAAQVDTDAYNRLMNSPFQSHVEISLPRPGR